MASINSARAVNPFPGHFFCSHRPSMNNDEFHTTIFLLIHFLHFLLTLSSHTVTESVRRVVICFRNLLLLDINHIEKISINTCKMIKHKISVKFEFHCF